MHMPGAVGFDAALSSHGGSSVTSMSSSKYTKQGGKFMESHLLPLLHGVMHSYPVGLTMVSFLIEFMQMWGFAMNPHVPGHFLATSIIYSFQVPLWDGEFMQGLITYSTFMILFWIVAAVLLITVMIFVLGLFSTDWTLRMLFGRGFKHVVNFLVFFGLIPTTEMLLSSFMCRSVPNTHASIITEETEFVPHILFFADKACGGRAEAAQMGFSIALLLVWCLISYVIYVTILPYSHDDPSFRRHCSATVDTYMFIYKTGLCVAYFLTLSTANERVFELIVALASFVGALLHGFFLPYYVDWMNQLSAALLSLIGWSAFTTYISMYLGLNVFVHQSVIYPMLVVGGVIAFVATYFLSGLRYNSHTRWLLRQSLKSGFVDLQHNPFAIAALQGDLDRLPFPSRLPTTDARLSPYHCVTTAVLEEGLRENELAMRTAAAQAAPAANQTTNKVNDECEGEHPLSANESMLQEAMRVQVVSPTISTAWVLTDAEVAIRFLDSWQFMTTYLPTPYMVLFASRILNRFMLKYKNDNALTPIYISFLCDHAPSLSRISLCIELERRASASTYAISNRFHLYYLNVHVKETLGIRNAIHQWAFRRARHLHEQTLLQTTMVWRSLMEEKGDFFYLYYFTNWLSEVRWECLRAYNDVLDAVVDDEALLQNVGYFMESVYNHRRVATLCTRTADVVKNLHAMRFQRSFNTQSNLDTALQKMDDDDAKEVALNKKKVEENGNSRGSLSVSDDFGSTRDSSVVSSSLGTHSSHCSSAVTSEGRSSQSKLRSGKRLAAQLVQRIQEVIQSGYNDLSANLSWGLLRYSMLFCSLIVLALIVANGIVCMTQFMRWSGMHSMIEDLCNFRTLLNILVSQFFKAASLLPESNLTILSDKEHEYLLSNITFLQALITAAESARNELIIGRNQDQQASMLARFTEVSGYGRLYSTVSDFEEYRVSFITHVPIVTAAARRLVAKLGSTPFYNDFMSLPDVAMVADNVQVTLFPVLDSIMNDLLFDMDTFASTSVIILFVCIMASFITIGWTGFLFLWNFRRASSIISGELSMFYVIPRDYIKRLAGDSQKNLENFMYTSDKGIQWMALADTEASSKEISALEMESAFGRPAAPGAGTDTAARLLTRLTESGGVTVLEAMENDVGHRLSTDHVDTEPLKVTFGDAEIVVKDAEHPTATMMLPNTEEATPATPSRAMESTEDADPATESPSRGEPSNLPPSIPKEIICDRAEVGTELPVARKEAGVLTGTPPPTETRALTLLNIYSVQGDDDTAHKAESLTSDSESEGGLVNTPDKNTTPGPYNEAETSKGFNFCLSICITLLTCAIIVAGLVFVIVGIFSISNTLQREVHLQEGMDCAYSVGNATFMAYFYGARFVAGELYEDYASAENAMIFSARRDDKCRIRLKTEAFFEASKMLIRNCQIAIALTVRNRQEALGNTDALYYFSMAANYTWNPFTTTITAERLLESYLTSDELERWFPYSSSEEDYARPAKERREIAQHTLFGPVGMAMLRFAEDSYKVLVADVIRDVRSTLETRFADVKKWSTLSVVAWCLVILCSITMVVIFRGSRVLCIFSCVVGLMAIVLAVCSGIALKKTDDLLRRQGTWLLNSERLGANVWEFFSLFADTIAYPHAGNDRSMGHLLNLTSVPSMVFQDTALFPESDSTRGDIDLNIFINASHARSKYIHYAWLSVVCAIHGRGKSSLFANTPQVAHTRWNMSLDEEYMSYTVSYPMDMFLTTTEKDVETSKPEEALKLAQGAVVSHFMLHTANAVIEMQGSLYRITNEAYVVALQASERQIQSFFWVQFGVVMVTFLVVQLIAVVIAIRSIQNYSSSEEKRAVYRAGFQSLTVKVIAGLAIIWILILASHGTCMIFIKETHAELKAIQYVMQLRWYICSLIANSSSLIFTTNHFTFMVRRDRLLEIVRRAHELIQNAYLSTKAAVKVRNTRNVALFGGTALPTFDDVMSPVKMSISCMNQADPVSGSQNPLVLQISVLLDIIRAIIFLPTEDTLSLTWVKQFLEKAFSRAGSVEYFVLFDRTWMQEYTNSQLRMRIIVSILFLIVGGLFVVVCYWCVLRPKANGVRQHSIGSKLMLTALPKDILDTIPEIREFYNPDVTNDQLKKRMLQSEKLLQNILPPSISRRLKNGERVIADAHASVTVVFAGLYGFDDYSHRLHATQLVHFLNGLVVAFDHIVDLLDLEKVKTIGDIYFFCGGLTPKTERDHPIRCMECSLFFFQALEDHNNRYSTPNIKLRVGIHTDAAVAGVIGNKKVAYDLWGDCVNTASRMMSTGIPGSIQISHETYEKVKAYYSFNDRRIQAKGKGDMLTHIYEDRVKSTRFTDMNWRVLQ